MSCVGVLKGLALAGSKKVFGGKDKEKP